MHALIALQLVLIDIPIAIRQKYLVYMYAWINILAIYLHIVHTLILSTISRCKML